MRCGILIIGSLLWDDGKAGERAAWRAARLDLAAQVPVHAPLYYGRKSGSRGDTYTMAFKSGEASGRCVVVPCTEKSDSVDKLVEEANALWQAEDANARPGTLHKAWGCVGVLFGSPKAHEKLAARWTAHFRKVEVRCLSVINRAGLLDIGWPSGLDGQPADFDVILATATKPEATSPTARAVADAWIGQRGGHENYFFNNVKHGIRTPDDLEIWHRIEERAPSWLGAPMYEEAIAMLRSESNVRNAASSQAGQHAEGRGVRGS